MFSIFYQITNLFNKKMKTYLSIYHYKTVIMSSDSSSPNSNDQPKKRGRKSIPPEQKKRIYHVKCPCCQHQFEFYHGMKNLKPPPVTTPEMSATEKNRKYHQRYIEKKNALKKIEDEIETSKCLLDQ